MKGIVGVLVALCMVLSFYGCSGDAGRADYKNITQAEATEEGLPEPYCSEDGIKKEGRQDIIYTLESLPDYAGAPYIELDGNQPDFSENDKQIVDAFECYSDLDSLGRCGRAYANICPELMPTEERGGIGQIKPSGWHTVKYSDRIEGNYLYNRCHLIGYQLAGENANDKNLITGTRYLNVEGMLPFEDMVDDYVDATGNHVLYRVTPIFEGENLIASGVEMEAWSVEDHGDGICFHVYCYNVQPDIEINYANGESWEAHDDKAGQKATDLAEETISARRESDTLLDEAEIQDYVLNTSTGKIHLPTCSSVDRLAAHNRKEYTGTIRDLISEGYVPCGNCLAAYRN